MSDHLKTSGFSEEIAPFGNALADRQSRMLEYANELGVNAEKFVEQGGFAALDQELRRAFRQKNAEAIRDWNDYIQENGTIAEQLGLLNFE